MKQNNNNVTPANFESSLDPNVKIKEEFWYEDCGSQLPGSTLHVSQLSTLQSKTPSALSKLVEPPGLLYRTDKKRKKPPQPPVSSRSKMPPTVQEPPPFLFVSSNEPDVAPDPTPAQSQCRDSNEMRHCLHCDFKTIHRTTMYSHFVRRHRGSTFECNQCKKKFSTNSRLREHLKWHESPENNETCFCCGRWFKNSAMLKQHMWKKHTARTFVCNFPGCKKSYCQLPTLEKHKVTHMAENLPKEQRVLSLFQCKDCGVVFKKKSLLLEHISSTHAQKINSAPKLYGNWDNSCKKVLLKNPGSIQCVNIQNSKLFICPHCSHIGKTRNGVAVHVARNHRSYKFECDYCKKLFGVKQDIWRHITCTHSLAPQTCEICGRQYKHMDSLRIHHITKHAGIPFQGKDQTGGGKKLSKNSRTHHHTTKRTGIPFQGKNQTSGGKTLSKNSKAKSTTSKINGKPLISTSKSLQRKQKILIHSAKMNPVVLLSRITWPLNKNKQLEHVNVKQESSAMTPASPVMAQADDMTAVAQENVYFSNVIIKEEFWVEDTSEPVGNNLKQSRQEHSPAAFTHYKKRPLPFISSQKNAQVILKNCLR